MGTRHTIETEVFAPGAPQHVEQSETPKRTGLPDWHVLASGALALGIAVGWLLGSTSDITRQAQVEQAIEIPEPDTLAAPAISWERSAVVPTADLGRLQRRVILTAGGGLVPLHGPSPGTGSEMVWTFEGETAVATRLDAQTPFGFMDGALLSIGESSIQAYDAEDLTQRSDHVLALQPELTVVRAQNESGLWIRREDNSLRYFDMAKKRFLTTYAQAADVPHLHGMTSTMLLWNDEDDPQAMPYDLSTLSPDGEVIPIDLTGREELPLRGYGGNAIVFGGRESDSETHLYFPEDQTWLTSEFSVFPEELILEAVVSPDRSHMVIVFSSVSSGEATMSKAAIINVATGATVWGFPLHNPNELPIEWLDESALLWVGPNGPESIQLNLFDLSTGEQYILADLSGTDWRLIVEPLS